MRSDWELSTRDTLTVQGGIFSLREGQTLSTLIPAHGFQRETFNEPLSNQGGNVLGRWTRNLSPDSDFSLQVYFDRYNREETLGSEKLRTLDIDFQHHVKLGSKHELIAGLGYRAMSDKTAPGYAYTYDPLKLTTKLFSTFVQDEILLAPSVSLTIGSKFEHNSYTGFEYEPSARLVWTPSSRQTLWTSMSRAIRQPSRISATLQVNFDTFPAGPDLPGVVRLQGNRNGKAERLRDFELGYRTQFNKRLSLDVATYFGLYSHLVSYEPGNPFFELSPAPPHLVAPLVYSDMAHGTNYGAEIFLNWAVNSRLRFSTGYSGNRLKTGLAPGSFDTQIAATPGFSPTHKFQVRTQMNVTRNMSWDSSVAYTGHLASGSVPAYVRLDSRVGWHARESVEFSIVGQNLLTARHLEFAGPGDLTLTTEVQRSVFGKITWRF